MKLNKSLLAVFLLLIVTGSVFRVAGFAPQIAMGIFGAAVIRDRRMAFLLPLVSMFFSDLLFEVLFAMGYAPYGGIYEGQLSNYLILGVVTMVGFMARSLKPGSIILVTLAAPLVYFLLSNFSVWIGFGGYQRPLNLGGLMLTYQDGLPFLKTSLLNTAVFSTFLFGIYFLVPYFRLPKKQLA
jgi:hypothetical protein